MRGRGLTPTPSLAGGGASTSGRTEGLPREFIHMVRIPAHGEKYGELFAPMAESTHVLPAHYLRNSPLQTVHPIQ